MKRISSLFSRNSGLLLALTMPFWALSQWSCSCENVYARHAFAPGTYDFEVVVSPLDAERVEEIPVLMFAVRAAPAGSSIEVDTGRELLRANAADLEVSVPNLAEYLQSCPTSGCVIPVHLELVEGDAEYLFTVRGPTLAGNCDEPAFDVLIR